MAAADGSPEESIRLLFVVTDTDEGKVAFHLDLGDGLSGTAGRLPRGEKADVTVTVKESAILPLWAGERSWDAAFMAGDLKVEGEYQRWVDELVPLFTSDAWAGAWEAAAA